MSDSNEEDLLLLAEKLARERQSKIDQLKASASIAVDTAESIARTARSKSSGRMAALKIDSNEKVVIPPSDLTGRFKPLR